MPTRGKRKKKYITTRTKKPILHPSYDFPKVIKKTHQRGGISNVTFDLRKIALEPGKRISKRGNVYYEYRRNRSDDNPHNRI